MKFSDAIIRFCSLIVFWGSGLGFPVFGGFVYEFSEGTGDKREISMVVSVEGDAIKMSQSDSDREETIFDAAKEALLMIDHKKRSYVSLDKAMVLAASEKLSKAMEEMEKQLASMPPAQREMMERMMKGAMPKARAALPVITFKRTGKTDTVAGIKAEQVEQFTDGVKTRDVWVASWDALEGGKSIQGAFVRMSELFGEIAKAFSQGPMSGMFASIGARNAMSQLGSLEGFPVKTVEYNSGGAAISEMVLTKFGEKAFADADFKAPKGYKKQKMDF